MSADLTAPGLTPETDFAPAVVYHPAEYIADEAMERGWTLWDLAHAMGGAPVAMQYACLQFYAICEPGVLLGDDGARDLARAFGTSVELWSRLDATWQRLSDRHSPLEPKHVAFYGLNDPVPLGEHPREVTPK